MHPTRRTNKARERAPVSKTTRTLRESFQASASAIHASIYERVTEYIHSGQSVPSLPGTITCTT